ncbi:MAG: thioredoxin family protein [Chlorobi bacterium]|nr:thioredoxin family protein [Chlorobiota bacterium]MBX7217936.1 thioredoxin family protein [Candidatus Kapabacteria bacterium]
MPIQSTMMPLGTSAPDFRLPDVLSGEEISLRAGAPAIATVVMFICNHCPYVIHVQDQIAAVATEYRERGVAFFGINSNDVQQYPEDSPEAMKRVAAEVGYPFPYLFDETQETARAYGAACTPEFYVFDANLMLAYHGQMDDARPRNDIPVTGRDLRDALDAIIEGRPVSEIQKPGIGCGIKWKIAE